MSQKRRNFLKSLGLAGVGFSLDFGKAQAAAAEKMPISVALTGKVASQGKGLAGVAVTDGVKVVLTDAKGNYQLETVASSEFVYIAIPRGYEFPHENGITQFFKKIDPTTGKFKADFELKKLDLDDSKHTFIVWADPQIQNEKDAELLKTQSAPDTRQLIENYGANTLMHGIGCGDLVWDKFELFEDYKEAVKMTGIPYFQVIGNHDMDIDSRADDYSSETFKKLFGPTYYSYNRGDVHYVVLDDVFYIGKTKKYIGYITEKQFAWLEQDLAQVKPGSTVVVSVHIPVYTKAHERNKTEESIGGVVANRKELYRILKPFKAHIMSGHTHFNEKIFDAENVIEHVHGTVCGAWWTGPICYDGTPSGYGVYEVNGADIQWYYKPVGQPKSHQMRIYPVGAVAEKPAHFAVNVWNWDPNWKVEWFEDGQAKGEMARETSFDPLSLELHLGAEKPDARGWVEPVLTDHIFFAQPSPNAQKIKVQVTDRFNQVYVEETSLVAVNGN